MTEIAIAAVAVLAYLAFLRWVKARYPGNEGRPSTHSDADIIARLARLEDRLSTIELQRAILRQVPNK